MKILALMTEAYGASGGIQQFNRDWTQAMVAAGHTVDIQVRRGLPGQWPDGVTQREAGSRFGYVASAFSSCRRLQPDLIFCGHANYALLSSILGRMSGLPVWLHCHGIEAWSRGDRLWRWTLEQFALITSASRYTRRAILSQSADPHRFKVLPNTVSERYCPGPRPEYLAERYGLQDQKVLLSVGRLASSEGYKGHDQVLRAMGEIDRADISYLIVGTGDDKPRLKALTQSLGLSNQVIFAGFVPDDEMPDHYRIADTFVMPSSGEGFGIVYLEAMACGIPAIGSGEAGSADPLSHPLGAQSDSKDLPVEIVRTLSSSKTDQRGGTFQTTNFQKHVRELVRHVSS